jgi:chromosome partitioning protein
MAQIITVANQKGGVGKSLLCINLAYVFFNSGLKVGLIDKDYQGSLSQILKPSDELILIPEDTALSDLKNLGYYHVIIIDTPPYLSNKLPEIFLISDYILLPTKAGIFDLMAIRATIGLIKEAQKVNINIQAGIVFNMVKSNSSITNEMRQLLLEYDIPVLDSVISDRVSYIRSLITGGILSSKDYNAKVEMTSLVNELLNRIGV